MIPDVELDNLTLTRGANEFAEGGALRVGDNSGVFVFNCLFDNNEAFDGVGGAIFGADAFVIIENTTFADNRAFDGGAIFNEGDTDLLVTNCTFSGNQASFGISGTGVGAAISTSSGDTDVNSSIFGNSVNGGNCDGVDDFGYNISDDASCGFAGTSVNNTPLFLDPAGLQNNGGPTKTFALQEGVNTSPAIDSIPVGNCLDFFGFPVTNDQRLFGRPDPGDPGFCDAGAFEDDAVAPIVIVPKTERVQIARSTSSNSDKVNMAFTFIYNGDPDCDIPTGGDEDALKSGIGVALFGGTCAALPASGLVLYLDPFNVHKVNHQQYGTLFQHFGAETVSARMVALPKPTNACGAWTLNLEVAGLNTPAMGLGGTGPFALVVTDLHGDEMVTGIDLALTLADITGDAALCFDVTNAVVGSQTPPPPHHGVRGRR